MAYKTIRLQDALPLLNGELPTSHASRMAAHFRSNTARQFCEDFGISFGGLAVGNREDLEKYCTLIGADIDAMVPVTPARLSGTRYYQIGAAVLPTHNLDRFRAWLCPECAAEDIASMPKDIPQAAVAIRRDNIISAIGACLRHGRHYVLAGQQQARFMQHDFAHYLHDLDENLPLLTTQSLRADQRRVDDYVRARLDGVDTNVPALDALPLRDAISALGWFGNLAAHGEALKMRKIDRVTRNLVYEAGFEHLMAGEEGICALIEARLMALDKTGRRHNSSVSAVMGRALGWLYQRPNRTEFEPLFRIVAEAIAKTLPGSKREGFLAARVEKRWHRLGSASAIIGIAPKEVRLLAQASDAAKDTGSGSRGGWVDLPKLKSLASAATSSAPIGEAFPRFLSFKDTARAFGINRTLLLELLEAEWLSPVMEKVRAAHTARYFDPSAISRWASDLCGDVEIFDAPPDGTFTLKQLRKPYPKSVSPLLTAISERKIWVARVPSAEQFSSIVLRKPDVRAVYYPSGTSVADNPRLLTVEEFGRAIQMGREACTTLVHNGFFRQANQVVRGGKVHTYMDEHEVERFWLEYVKGVEVAKHFKIRPADVTTHMANLGVPPVDTGSAPIVLFRRVDFNRVAF